jgi:hypothetical protein
MPDIMYDDLLSHRVNFVHNAIDGLKIML